MTELYTLQMHRPIFEQHPSASLIRYPRHPSALQWAL